jgi:type II secretory pathway pseudopilin PulG
VEAENTLGVWDPTAESGRIMIRRRRDSGLSMIELIIALAVMVLALIALMSSVISSSKISDSSKESALAYEAARAKIEEMRTYTKCLTFNNVFNYYKSGQAANTATVTGLNAIKVGGVAQPVLQIFFPTSSTVLTDLSEALVPATTNKDLNYIGTRMGLPKDLDRNGSDGGAFPWDTGGTLNTGYGILPVMVRVKWESAGKLPAYVEVVTYITEK